ncbi:MAG: hypothetical protein QOH25_1499 [Acidobacteriota bacterium]|jgi:hypothetical protein|nr:hypothetical protein [Acidobacteriota bacterium]
MADLLSSASLLVAIIAVLYGLWYPDISRGINMEVPQYKEQCAGPLSTVNLIMKRRALPLVLISVGLAIVFVKDTIRILYNSTISLGSGIGARLLNYDGVNTAFVFVEILLICVSIQLIADFIKLARKKGELKSKPSVIG